jgi:hypothetical protein
MERMSRYTITGSRYQSADTASRAVLYTASECTGCFDRPAMKAAIAALAVGESVTYPALRFVDGPADPAPIVITRNF